MSNHCCICDKCLDFRGYGCQDEPGLCQVHEEYVEDEIAGMNHEANLR